MILALLKLRTSHARRVVAGLVLAAVASVPAPATGAPERPLPGDRCTVEVPASSFDPAVVSMTSSGRAPGASGTLRIRLASSPTGLALAEDGSYRYEIRVEAGGLRGGAGVHHVAWAATPELDRHRRLGPLGEDGAVEGEVTWNKFLVFVTAERRPEPESWSQRILLSALSPSGRMHTMAGHGPFSGEPCLDPRP